MTSADVDYVGSVTIGRDLLRAAGMEPYEKVELVNLRDGVRWSTYILPGEDREFGVNGGGAHLARVGDRLVAMTFITGVKFHGAWCVIVDEQNRIVERRRYGAEE